MKKRQWVQWAIALVVVAGLRQVSVVSASNFTGEYRQGEILSFGSSLNKAEEQALRDYFGVSEDMDAIYVDNATAIKQLGLAPNALDNYTGGWYSSAFVKLTNKGGVQVTSKNVNVVTNEMFANALITSGILNCEVNVSAPFMVTGESALAGILAGAEEIMGESLSEENKVVAKEEIDTTLQIADEILSDSSFDLENKGESSVIASGIINDIKEQVIKDSPNATQIGQIIVNVTNNYGVELSPESQARVQRLMEDVNELDIDYKDIKDTMNQIGSQISNSLKEAGIQLKESGFLERLGNGIMDVFKSIWNWLKSFVSHEMNEINDQSSSTIHEVVETPEEEMIEENVTANPLEGESNSLAEESEVEEMPTTESEPVVEDVKEEEAVSEEVEETTEESVTEAFEPTTMEEE